MFAVGASKANFDGLEIEKLNNVVLATERIILGASL